MPVPEGQAFASKQLNTIPLSLMKFLLLTVFVCVGLNSFAQVYPSKNEIKDSLFYAMQQQNHVSAGMMFMSDEIYNGQRIDTLPQWGIHPFVSWMFAKGFSFNYFGDYYSKTQPHYSLTSIGISKDFTIAHTVDAAIGYNYWIANTNDPAAEKYYSQNLEVNGGYGFGKFYAGLYSMLLFGGSFSSFYEPSISWSSSSWKGARSDVRIHTEIAAFADIGNRDASARPFVALPPGLAKKNNNFNLPPVFRSNTTADENPKAFGMLNYQLQVIEDINWHNNSLSAVLNFAVPAADAASNQGQLMPYFTLKYDYTIYTKHHGVLH